MVGKSEFEYWLDYVKDRDDKEIKEKLLSIRNALNKSDNELENALYAFMDICKKKYPCCGPCRGGSPSSANAIEINKTEIRNDIKIQLGKVLNK
ncbi:MAG: hypothetical protein CVT89_00715 [Candidatus Altiarchaeales archaeon HGW-Altiarchaeales-2]|nr:MAG: hypothetical protein CVT89_00715 [Candidatus Altiarchaeales archaeon HGW-Altiarchaeales-2]